MCDFYFNIFLAWNLLYYSLTTNALYRAAVKDTSSAPQLYGKKECIMLIATAVSVS